MGSEKLEVESHTYLLSLDDDLDLLHSMLKKAEKILTKEKAKYFSKLTVNLDRGIRKSIALQRSSLFHIKRESSGTDKPTRDLFVQTNSTSGGSQTNGGRRVARNSQWGGCLGGLGAEPPAAGGQWGSGGEAPSCRRLGVWGQNPQPPEARGSGGGAPSARKFCIFLQK